VISSFEVGATFRIVNEASPQITKILLQVRELNAAIDKAKASMAGLAKIPGLTAAIGETNALATAWREVAGASGAATRAMGRATGRTNAIAGPGDAAALAQTQALTQAYNQLAASMANVRAAGSGPRVGLPGGASGGGGGGNRGVFRPGARGGGVHGGPGMHIGGPSIGIPGGGHIRFGGALAAGGGFVAYGAYEAAQMEDAVFQLNYHAGLEQNDSNRKRFRVIGHLIEKHGVDNMVLTLRILTETHPANRSLLNRVVITAVNAICRVRHYTRHDLRFLEVFDEVDLGEVQRRAVSFGMWMYPTWTMVAVIILERLRAALSPLEDKPQPKAVRVKSESKPPRSITRIPEIQAKLELGRKLLALRATTPGNCNFGRLLRKQFDLDQASATEAMSVARAYGQRWEITSRLSWAALVELSSPSVPATVRRELEAKIIAGKRIGALQIRRARGPLAPGRPRRQCRRPPHRMAA
jgi:hypothetical protein